jgi:type I restriction enzyme, S subunit
MSNRFKPYQEYQSTGLDWLGRVPKFWELRRLGSYFRERREKVSDTDYPALSVTMQGIVPQLETAAKTNDGDNRKLVRIGDFAINSRSDRKGSSGVSQYEGSVSLITIVLQPLGLNPAYVHHLFRSEAFQEEFYRFGKGIVADLWSTNFEAMKNITIPVMSIDEQKQIAAFLDYETARIDALIEKQQQLIALLGEKRQAVISHAVTKGLNPDAPMRNSGVEWLGEVPAHWKVCRLKHAMSFLTSGPRGWSDQISDDGRSVFLQSGDLNDELGIRFESAKRINPPGNAEGIRTKMQVGDLVCCVTGANTGRIAVATTMELSVFVNQHLALIRPIRAIANPRFLATLMSASPTKTYFSLKQYGLKEGLSLTNVAETPICLPPISEQKLIVAYLDETESKMSRLRTFADDQVELLQERRTALISAAVTGKIDVRGWKRPSSDSKHETETGVT